MPDAIFTHPRLAAIYDAFDGDRCDLDLYLGIVEEFQAAHVLDIGCGTGSLPLLLAARGTKVTAVDPAEASLDVARTKTPDVTWILGDATSIPEDTAKADLATMTGNVAQVFLEDRDWAATLRGIHDALRPGGVLVFETRRPERRAWEGWARDPGPHTRDVPGVGVVEERRSVTEVRPPFVSFRYTYTFQNGETVHSDSTLRFRDRQEVTRSLEDAGFTVLDVRDAPDRPGLEHVFIAAR
ncbi:methyltransferase domain-containing protein [Dactylosporangium sp. NPDC050588]|uniref:class I SAM-dependent methyltransferase n=1 Tax=Dactylosporangium sp. NPDC050588 TaxID=3157211 RepID=UPI003402D69D